MKTREPTPEVHQDLYSNLIHLYVLHHACRQPTFGLQVIEEVARLGYKLSPGTMFPLLDALCPSQRTAIRPESPCKRAVSLLCPQLELVVQRSASARTAAGGTPMRFGTKDGRQLVIDWPMRDVALGEVLRVTGNIKMRGRYADFGSRFMTAVWFCVAKAMGREAQTETH